MHVPFFKNITASSFIFPCLCWLSAARVSVQVRSVQQQEINKTGTNPSAALLHVWNIAGDP